MDKRLNGTSEWLHQAHHLHICTYKKNDIWKEISKKQICMSLIKVSNMVPQNIFDDNLEGWGLDRWSSYKWRNGKESGS